MATTPTAPTPKTNRIGLQVMDYRGSKSTLCAGCGHNAISERIIDAFYEMGIEPETVAKLSGIGPQVVKKLNDAGVFHYWQIGALTADEAAKLDGDLKLNGKIQGWIEQARELAAA